LNDYTPPGVAEYADVSVTHQSDIFMADTISDFILYHLQSGRYSSPNGWEFSYSRSPTKDPYEEIYGDLFGQRNRFHQLSSLVRETLEMRGLQVRTLTVFEQGRGLYIKWDIDPIPSSTWNFAWQRVKDKPNQEVENEHCGGDKMHFCRGHSESICRLKRFLRDPKEFFRNYWD
jgi:hypothetical protein